MLAIAVTFILPLTVACQQYEQMSLRPAQRGKVRLRVIGGGRYSGSKIIMAVLAQYLASVIATPVTSNTGLTGLYDVTLGFPSPVEVLVVDHVEKEISK